MEADNIDLNGDWRVLARPLGDKGQTGLLKLKRVKNGWIKAGIPGEIHLDLMRAGQMPDPLIGLNAPRCRWPERNSWWFRRYLKLPKRFAAHELQTLVVDRADYSLQVFLNGQLVGEGANAFIESRFDVRRFLKPGRNEVVLRLTCGNEMMDGKPMLEPPQHQRITGNSLVAHRYDTQMLGRRGWLRKPHFSYGWDWTESLPNIGIRGGVRLEGKSHAAIRDVRLSTILSGRRAFIESEIVIQNLHIYEERPCTVEFEMRSPSGEVIRRRSKVIAKVGQTPLHDRFEVPHPRLWWPNGMGDQPLYGVKVRVLAGRTVCDSRSFRHGLRTINVDRSPLREGSRFCIQVNGRDVFCRGANWVPCDLIMARADGARYRQLIEEARAANYNMLRVWGGGIYEHEAFYDACDEAGILIWQDFMFACTQYPCDDPGFRQTVRDEAEEVIRRLRHHSCIALWCGNNENISWMGFGAGTRGIRIYNEVLPEVCRMLDPDRFYWPSSPCGGEKPTSQIEGDAHPWPYTMGPDENTMPDATDGWKARFVTEFGAMGPPVKKTIEQYLGGRINRRSRAWQMHNNVFEKGLMANAIRRHYAEPEGLTTDEWLAYGSAFQSMILENNYRAQRFRKLDPDDDCQGFLIWMFNDCWGEVGWSILDCYQRRKPSFHAVRRACRPAAVIVRRRGSHLVTRVVNDTLYTPTVTVRCGWVRVDGTAAEWRNKRLTLPANGMREIARDPIPPVEKKDPRHWIYAAVMVGPGIQADQCVWTALPVRELELPAPRISVNGQDRLVTLESSSYCHAVHAEDADRVRLSDNYFDLLPGIPLTVSMHGRRKGRLFFRSIAPQASTS